MKSNCHSKKKNAVQSRPIYTPGRNMFGNKAEIRFVVLKRETALQQMIDAICQLEGEMEYTFDMRCFQGHPEELEQVMSTVELFMAMKERAKKPGCPVKNMSTAQAPCK